MSSPVALNSNAATLPAGARPAAPAKGTARQNGSADDTMNGDAGAAAGATAALSAGLLLAWQDALEGHDAARGVLPAAPSRTEAALQAVREAAATASTSAACEAEFRTAPGEPWQLALQRDAGTPGLRLSVGAEFVPPAWATAQLQHLDARLRRQGLVVDQLGWRGEGHEQQHEREDRE